jgi:hypothetical protein
MFCWYFEDISIAIETSRRSNGLSLCPLRLRALCVLQSPIKKLSQRAQRRGGHRERFRVFVITVNQSPILLGSILLVPFPA